MSLSQTDTVCIQIRSYYAINPDTGVQASQKTMVEPIDVPMSEVIMLTTHDSKAPPPTQKKKRKVARDDNQEESEDEDGLYIPGQSAKKKRVTSPRKKKRIAIKPDLERDYEEPITPILLPPRSQRRTPYVELPRGGTVEMAGYQQLKADDLQGIGNGEELGKGKRARRSIFNLSAVLKESRMSPGSSWTDVPASPANPLPNGRVVGRGRKPRTTEWGGARTCHQCRNSKSMLQKMVCYLCHLNFCERCVRMRYGEVFDAAAVDWKCPRCYGVCNCSLCLRKIGLDFVLDDPEISSYIWRILHPKGDEDSAVMDVCTFLARQRIIVGGEDWIAMRCKKGYCYYIGERLTKEKRYQYRSGVDPLEVMPDEEAGEDHDVNPDTCSGMTDVPRLPTFQSTPQSVHLTSNHPKTAGTKRSVLPRAYIGKVPGWAKKPKLNPGKPKASPGIKKEKQQEDETIVVQRSGRKKCFITYVEREDSESDSARSEPASERRPVSGISNERHQDVSLVSSTTTPVSDPPEPVLVPTYTHESTKNEAAIFLPSYNNHDTYSVWGPVYSAPGGQIDYSVAGPSTSAGRSMFTDPAYEFPNTLSPGLRTTSVLRHAADPNALLYDAPPEEDSIWEFTSFPAVATAIPHGVS